MHEVLVNEQVLSRHDPAIGGLLEMLYIAKERPSCLCREPAIEMYIAKIGENYVLKRLPNTGSLHDPSCDSYEIPQELSGLGQLMGSAIRDDPRDGVTELRFDFSLTKTQKGAANKTQGAGDPAGDAKAETTKLTLRALIHYLWDEAGFTKWSPAMAGKRNWYVIRKYLLEACQNKAIKGGYFSQQVFIPETYSPEHKDVIQQRRANILSRIIPVAGKPRNLMLLIGEVKQFAETRFGHKVIIKHLPDYHLMMDDSLYKRLCKNFKGEIEMSSAEDDSFLVMVSTFGLSPTGVPTAEEAALMVVNKNWIPYENIYEKNLIDDLTQSGRRFVKGLRYKLSPSKPMASLVLSDTEPQPTAMYVIAPDATEEFVKSVDELAADSQLASWIWTTGMGSMASIPVPGRQESKENANVQQT